MKTVMGRKLTDLARQWILPYATGEKKALLERATKESCTQKNEFCIQRGYMATVATWQLTGLELTAHTEARATRMASLRLGNQRP